MVMVGSDWRPGGKRSFARESEMVACGRADGFRGERRRVGGLEGELSSHRVEVLGLLAGIETVLSSLLLLLVLIHLGFTEQLIEERTNSLARQELTLSFPVRAREALIQGHSIPPTKATTTITTKTMATARPCLASRIISYLRRDYFQLPCDSSKLPCYQNHSVSQHLTEESYFMETGRPSYASFGNLIAELLNVGRI
ncbi:hypothetical protein KQX54_005158 [Cotesia glomerata]|uniref:Uncharacterized protein n=1 Tax=Cotesia glomerata TaxID=32391 RepID=A0AAV7HHB0_COTGL|nr:hypothetical protein KQX54_005158 [Cotesia glomerata]